MFARISNYKMKPEKIKAGEAKLSELMPQIMAVPGLKTFTSVVDSDGSGVVVSVVESEEISNANQKKLVNSGLHLVNTSASHPQ